MPAAAAPGQTAAVVAAAAAAAAGLATAAGVASGSRCQVPAPARTAAAAHSLDGVTAPGVAAAAVRTAAALGVVTGTAASPDSAAVGGCAGGRVALPLLLLRGCAVAAAASAAAGAVGGATPGPFGCPRPCRPSRSPRLAPGSHSPHCRLPQSSTAGRAPRQTRAAQHTTQAAAQRDSWDESCVKVSVCLQGWPGSKHAPNKPTNKQQPPRGWGRGWHSTAGVLSGVRACAPPFCVQASMAGRSSRHTPHGCTSCAQVGCNRAHTRLTS